MIEIVKRFKTVRNIFNTDVDVVDVVLHHADFDRPSSTDPSYYVPSSELAKQANKLGHPSNCLYDNCDVDKDIMDLRRPGLDISEQYEISKRVIDNCMSEAEYNRNIRAENVKKVKEQMRKANSVTDSGSAPAPAPAP